MNTLQYAICDLSFSSDNMVGGHEQFVFIVAGFVQPGAAINVIDEQITVIFQVLGIQELAAALMNDPANRNRLDFGAAG